MMKNSSIFTATLLSAAALVTTASATSAPGSSIDAIDFGRTLAATARSAENMASPRDAASIQKQVAASVEELIVGAARTPSNVRVALQQAVFTCIRPAEANRLQYSCPTTPSGIAGLQDVLNTVTALIDGASTAAVEGGGSAALPPPPQAKLGAAGSSDYLNVQ